jgi:23S rRNA (uracil1939-C5)-methyltransferase
LVCFDRCPLLHPGLNEVLVRDAATRPDGECHYEYAPADGAWSPAVEAVEKVVAGERFRVSRGSFFQASEEGAAALVTLFEEVLRGVEPRRVLDLYCGVGLFSRIALRHGSAVTGIELSETAQRDFAANLGDSVPFIRADIGRLARLPDAELIVVDPPRTGLDPAALNAICRSTARDLWYVSCDGPTFVRDLLCLEKEGRFTLRTLAIIDQFPDTRHL